MSHKKRKTASRAVARGVASTTYDSFQQFASQTSIRWCLYKDTAKILGRTFGALVLQDFEAMTPNVLARTIETVEGGGIVVILLRTMKSLEEVYTLPMDTHMRFRNFEVPTVTGSHSLQLMPRFNQRFILTMVDCDRCLFVDDQFNILPISANVLSNLEDSKTHPCLPSQVVL